MEEHEEDSRRRIVLHPRTAAARRVDRKRSYGSNIRGFTVQNDDVFQLVDEQRNMAIRSLLIILIPIALTILSFVVAPQLTDFSVRGIPFPWLLMGPGILFGIVLVAGRYTAKAEKKERTWATKFEADSR